MAVRRPTRMSQRGLEFLVAFEGIRLKAYKAVPTERFWTIGVGHYGPDVHPGMTITRGRAFELLRADLRRFETAVLKTVPWRWRRTQARFDALVSIAFNLGEAVLTPEPPLTSLGQALRARRVTTTGKRAIAAAMMLYVYSGPNKLEGLVRRRRAEGRLITQRRPTYSTR